MSRRAVKKNSSVFSFRVRIGDYEVEISGIRDEVLKTVKELPRLIGDVYGAFESCKPKTKATLTVKTATAKAEAPILKYPKISGVKSCGEAILKVLESDWGKWRPRTIVELKNALRANDLRYPGRTFAGVLTGLVRKGKVRRWKTDAGYVYILAEEEVLA
ncbi:hypothetical protein J7L33_04545 [Candidatus Bathyarchaeota archaeon]|nr:hypothetical protein [Candidatus Bathyarchaeota archaeon]